jgi:hypothetical protein
MEVIPMPFRRAQRLVSSRRWLAALALCVVGALPLGCGYQLQLQGTDTPTPAAAADALHVRTVGSAATPGAQQTDAAPASLIDQMVHRYLDSAGTGAGGASDAATQTAQSAQPSASPLDAQPSATSASAPLARYAAQAQPPLKTQSDTVLPPVTAANVSGDRSIAPQTDAAPAATPAANASPAANGAATIARTLTVAAPQAQVTSVALAVTFPVASAVTATTVTKTATPVPASTAAPTSPPPPAAPRAPVVLFLQQGPNDFIYAGASQSVSAARGSIAGQYSAVYYTPPGGTQTFVYRPGIDPALTVSAGTWMRVVFTGAPGTRFAMFPIS